MSAIDGPRPESPGAREIRIVLDEFGAQALSDEAARQGIAVDELARHAIAYYLADLDSGRLARNVQSRGADPGER